MRGSVLCNLALVAMFWYSRALISDTRNQNDEPFCLYTTSALEGWTQCSFLRRESSTASLHFYRAVWTAELRVRECWISTEAALIKSYLTFCREERAWDSGGASFSRPNMSLLLKPGGPCQFHRRNLDLSHQAGSKTRRKRAWILPGTLWCGRGSSAGEYEQLGMFELADRCCREHDHCSHIIRPFTVNYGVFNPSFFTISHCDCDYRFKQCLLNVNDSVSNMVGYTFFHILKLRCFDLIKKRRCTQLNWFGMCTSVQDAPFAILKNPIPYNISSSDAESSGTSKSPSNGELPFANGKLKNSKPQRRRKQKGQRRNDTEARGDTFLMTEKMQKRSDKSKQLSPRTPPLWKIPTHSNLLTIHNSTFFHQKNLTIIKQETVIKTKHMHKMTESPEPAKNTQKHTTLFKARGLSAQKPKLTCLKKICTKKKTTTLQSQNTTVHFKMFRSNKSLMSNQNCDSMLSSVDHNFQSTQQKGMNYKMKNAAKRKSLGTTESPIVLTSLSSMFPMGNNKKKGNTLASKTSDPTIISLPSGKMAMLPKQKIKARNSKNKLPFLTHASKRKKPTRSKPAPTTRPKTTRSKDIVLSTKTTFLVSVSFSQNNLRLKKYLSDKQETLT
uniref:phospholipase A2 n=1 Tax=Astyanax mexicanus TaxID=7994 RepID=A0A3B1JMT9_ASTMX